jgi:hypothetical protein
MHAWHSCSGQKEDSCLKGDGILLCHSEWWAILKWRLVSVWNFPFNVFEPYLITTENRENVDGGDYSNRSPRTFFLFAYFVLGIWWFYNMPYTSIWYWMADHSQFLQHILFSRVPNMILSKVSNPLEGSLNLDFSIPNHRWHNDQF